MECKWYNLCPMKYFYENGKMDDVLIKKYCFKDWKKCVRYQKVENGVHSPDNLLQDGSIDINLK